MSMTNVILILSKIKGSMRLNNKIVTVIVLSIVCLFVAVGTSCNHCFRYPATYCFDMTVLCSILCACMYFLIISLANNIV